MFSLFLYLIVSVHSIHAGSQPNDDNQEMILKYPKINIVKPFTILKDKPVRIVFENWNATGVTCHAYDANKLTTFLNEMNRGELNKPNFTVLVGEVTEAMSTKWKCTINIINYPPRDVIFNVHVKNVRKVIVTVNHVKLKHSTATLSATEDGRDVYYYEDGETVDLTCQSRTKESGNYLSLVYYNDQGEIVFKTDIIYENAKFRALMKETNNNFYIDCIYYSSLEQDEFIYRNVFVHQYGHKTNSNIIVSVNGLRLVPYSETSYKNRIISVKNYNFTFQYIPGQPLTVSCWSKRDNLTVIGDHFTVIRNESSRIDFKLDTLYYEKKKSFSCVIDNINRKVNAIIHLVPDLVLYESGLRLIGLNPKNTLYQYSDSSRQWIIGYEFVENEQLSLTCVSWFKQFKIKWIFDGAEYESSSDFIPEITDLKPRSAQISLTLLAKHNNSKIICQQKIVNKGTSSIATSSTIYTVEVQLNLKPKALFADSVVNNTFWLILGVVGVCIILIVLIICIVIWRRKVKNTTLMENMYDYVEIDNTPIPPFPSQWENQYENLDEATEDSNVMLDNFVYSGNTSQPENQLRENNVAGNENPYSEIVYVDKPNNRANSAYIKRIKSEDYDPRYSYDRLRRSGLNNETNRSIGYDNLKINNINLDHNNDTALYKNVDKAAPIYAKVNRPKSTRNDLYVNTNTGQSSSKSVDNSSKSIYENI